VDVLLVVIQLGSPTSSSSRLSNAAAAAEFTPRDVQLVHYDSKLRVVARTQEVTSSCEFSREMNVTSALHRATLRAVLQPRNARSEPARLWVAAATVTSSRWRTSEAQLVEAVSGVLPSDGQPISVDLR